MTCTTAVNVKNLNAALEKHPELFNKPADQLVRDLSSIPRDIPTAARSNGGGHVNHTMFWQIMKSKGGGEPTGKIADAIRNTIGGFDTFKQQFNDAGAKQFGSGWVWLAQGNGKIQILTTPNQDNPLSQGLFPIMGNDLWEHAYYLDYNSRRPEYLAAWWNVVNWDEVEARFEQAAKGAMHESILAPQ
jgi:Fe-Mn family superoxide dismutase